MSWEPENTQQKAPSNLRCNQQHASFWKQVYCLMVRVSAWKNTYTTMFRHIHAPIKKINQTTNKSQSPQKKANLFYLQEKSKGNSKSTEHWEPPVPGIQVTTTEPFSKSQDHFYGFMLQGGFPLSTFVAVIGWKCQIHLPLTASITEITPRAGNIRSSSLPALTPTFSIAFLLLPACIPSERKRNNTTALCCSPRGKKRRNPYTCFERNTMGFFLLQVLGRQSGSAGVQVAEPNETPHPLSYVWVKIGTVPKRLLTLTPLGPGLPSGPAKPYYKKTRVVLHLNNQICSV